MRLEKTIEAEACRVIKLRLGIDNVKFTPRGRRGYPDRLFWVPGGRPLLVEFKRPGEKLEPLQKAIHERLRSLGYDVTTCWTVNEALHEATIALGRSLSKRRV